MRKTVSSEKPEGQDRWLLTYADMITLLMAFFIMMYSMSVLNLSKFREAAISIKSGFGGTSKGQGTMRKAKGVSPASVSWQVVEPLVTYAESGKVEGLSVGEDKRGLVITMSSDTLLFNSGSADIRPEAHEALGRVADVLRKSPNAVQVEGHTCNLPIRGGSYATNWELSTARATRVLRYLVEECNLGAGRFSAAGYGSSRPVQPNDNEADRSKNRRVEIVLLRPELAAVAKPEEPPTRIMSPARVVIRNRD